MLDLRSTGRRFKFWPPTVECNPGQVNTYVPLSPSSIIWHQPNCLVAGKITVGLMSHWPHVTDISGSPLMGREGDDGMVLVH